MKKIINYFYRLLNKQKIETVFDPKIDLNKLSEAEKINFNAGCIDLINKGVIGKLISHRANMIKTYIAMEAIDWHDVELNRMRLYELDRLILEIKRLGQKPKDQAEIVDKFSTL